MPVSRAGPSGPGRAGPVPPGIPRVGQLPGRAAAEDVLEAVAQELEGAGERLRQGQLLRGSGLRQSRDGGACP